MQNLTIETGLFKARKESLIAEAAQRAALQLACGIDLAAAIRLCPQCRKPIVKRVERALRRERIKALNRHWSYDLNRHIALKQALLRIAGGSPMQMKGGAR